MLTINLNMSSPSSVRIIRFEFAATTALFDSGASLGFYADWQRSQQKRFTSDSSKWSPNPPFPG